MHEKSKTKTRASMALALCFCVVALTSFLAVKASLNKITGSDTAAGDVQTPVTENQEAAVQTPVVDSQDNASSAQDNNTSDSAQSAADYIIPLEGNIQLKYSMDGLVYSKTLDQYMTHPGIDISAELSTEVRSIADGTVTKVCNDDRYGVTVFVTHDDGLVSVYSNLAEQGLVETGDDVKQGDVVGCVGDTALFESLEEAHLHFEMNKDGNPVDPGEFIDAFASGE